MLKLRSGTNGREEAEPLGAGRGQEARRKPADSHHKAQKLRNWAAGVLQGEKEGGAVNVDIWKFL